MKVLVSYCRMSVDSFESQKLLEATFFGKPQHFQEFHSVHKVKKQKIHIPMLLAGMGKVFIEMCLEYSTREGLLYIWKDFTRQSRISPGRAGTYPLPDLSNFSVSRVAGGGRKLSIMV
jgi:hypothetical protein